MQLNNRALNVPDSARVSVAQGRLIEAIKSLRDANPGLQLRDAKAAVDALAAHAPAAAPASGRPGHDRSTSAAPSGPGVEAALARGDVLGAIKALREATAMPLSQAKAEIEQRMKPATAVGKPAAQSAHTPTIAPGDSPGGLRWLLVVAVVAVLAGVVLALRG
ncbi:MAG TPA: hypothetical protein VLK29_11980 [Luteimonas sp.]|nr:hypothetical protein [Luteimonas sp.]